MNKNIKSVLIGPIIFFAFFYSTAWGGKPKIEKVSSTMRPLSGMETKALIERIPEILTDALGAVATNDIIDDFKKMDTVSLKYNLGITELETPLLQRSFLNSRFYRGLKLDEKPPYPYLIAITGNKFYHMPSSFNRLLFDNGLEINDKNIIELAKAFVIIALEGQDITLLEGKRINKRIMGEGPYQAMVKMKINDKIEEWYFDVNPLVAKGQLQTVSILELSTGQFHHRYFPLIVPKEKSKEEK